MGKAKREQLRIQKANEYQQAFNHGFAVGRDFGRQEAQKEANEKIWSYD
jgi:hypothetical protein